MKAHLRLMCVRNRQASQGGEAMWGAWAGGGFQQGRGCPAETGEGWRGWGLHFPRGVGGGLMRERERESMHGCVLRCEAQEVSAETSSPPGQPPEARLAGGGGCKQGQEWALDSATHTAGPGLFAEGCAHVCLLLGGGSRDLPVSGSCSHQGCCGVR